MLNYNKIHSSINFQRTAKSTLAKYMGIANSTLIDRLDKKNLTPDDVEKIAAFFQKPIAYYFDSNENELRQYSLKEALQGGRYPEKEIEKEIEKEKGKDKCEQCIEKDEKIKDLRENINDLRKHIILLESSLENKCRQSASG